MSDIEKKFEKLMRKAGLEKLGERPERESEKSYFIAIYHDPSLPEGSNAYIYDKFATKEERDRWYFESGREIARVHGGNFEFPPEPLSEEEIKKQKSGQ